MGFANCTETCNIFILYFNSHFIHSGVVGGELATTPEPFPGVGYSVFTIGHVLGIFGQRAFTAIFCIGSPIHSLWIYDKAFQQS